MGLSDDAQQIVAREPSKRASHRQLASIAVACGRVNSNVRFLSRFGRCTMNRLLGSGLMLIGLCSSVVPSFAQKPPTPKPLAERVDLATHVFVGKAKIVRACELVDGSLREVVPEPAYTGPGVVLELEVNVEEQIFPVTDDSPK